jgi:1-acyl-sn-glycerol-3-phosphate acyltransferase
MAGESLVVFPQGTILGIESDFRLGAFALARATGRPLLPVALTGSHRVWEHPYTPRLRYGQRLSLRVLAPVVLPAGCGTPELEQVRAELQTSLKAAALSGHMAPTRRFVPSRDGYWDGFAYHIDPAFPDLAADIARHRVGQANQHR